MGSLRGIEINVLTVEEVKDARGVIEKDLEALRMGPKFTRRRDVSHL